MRKVLTLIVMFLMGGILFAQTPDQSIRFRKLSVDVDGVTVKTAKFLFPYEWVDLTDPDDGKVYTSGFYSVWIKGDTTDATNGISASHALTVKVFGLATDGTVGDRDSTTVCSAFDWTEEANHGPFSFTLDPGAGLAFTLVQAASDTAKIELIIWY